MKMHTFYYNKRLHSDCPCDFLAISWSFSVVVCLNVIVRDNSGSGNTVVLRLGARLVWGVHVPCILGVAVCWYFLILISSSPKRHWVALDYNKLHPSVSADDDAGLGEATLHWAGLTLWKLPVPNSRLLSHNVPASSMWSIALQGWPAITHNLNAELPVTTCSFHNELDS